MELKQKTFRSLEELKYHILSGHPTLYVGSQTSTVIPFENYSTLTKSIGYIGNISQLPKKILIDEKSNLVIEGGVTWKEAKEFCLSRGREIMTSPTEELACVLSGVATSCTGERCFGFGTLRDQIVELEYINYKGEVCSLKASHKLSLGNEEDDQLLAEYVNSYGPYSQFKNAPFPRFEFETDLMTGTEGQLGVVTKAVIKTVPRDQETFVFLSLPKWEENYEPHLEIFEKVQQMRDVIRSCELLDENSISYLEADEQIIKNRDVVFLEISKNSFDDVYEKLLSQLKLISEDDVFEVPVPKVRQFRMNIPRKIFEMNSQMKVTKKGTDVQVSVDKFKDLLDLYRSLAKQGIRYNMFGHFGDAHLHFNFMPTKTEEKKCIDLLKQFYIDIYELNGSPFAEHGIGILKKKFIETYYSLIQRQVFRLLKDRFDPDNNFFPNGFMGEGN